jgi:hypothetical protein
MKKLIVSAAIVLGSLSTYAQASTDTKSETITTTSSQAVSTETKGATQEEFKAITAEEVPAPVHAALEVAHPGAVVESAHINEAKEYKLEIAVKDEKSTLYSDAEGNWIEK